MELYLLSLYAGLDKMGYIGIEMFLIGTALLINNRVTPKDWPVDLKVGAGLLGSSILCLGAYTAYKVLGA